MLDGPRDAEGDVKAQDHDLPSLTELTVVEARPASIAIREVPTETQSIVVNLDDTKLTHAKIPVANHSSGLRAPASRLGHNF